MVTGSFESDGIKRIESPRHPLIKHWSDLRNRNHRSDRDEQVMIEGGLLIGEIAPFTIPRALIGTSMEAIEQLYEKSFKGRNDVKRYLLSERAMKRLSGLITPSDHCLICQKPPLKQINGDQRWLICDRIRDPGNLGTLMRTACALTWDGVYLLGDCCDPYNAKALRAARGSSFKIGIDQGDFSQLIHQKVDNTALLIATARGAMDPFKFRTLKTGGIWLVVGNESRGVCPKLEALGQSIAIRATGMESLNVACAGAILMHFLGHKNCQ